MTLLCKIVIISIHL